jgi:hypothetical protein
MGNLEANMGMNINIHPHYGRMFYFIIKFLLMKFFSPIILIS